MKQPRTLLCRAFLIACVLLFARAASAQQAIEYELRFDKPNTHLLDITLRAGGLRGPAVEFAMPAWAPGWYVINDYAKEVQGFEARGADGKPLPWRKTDKQTWRVEIGSGSAATIHYKLFANAAAVDWTQYNDIHAHIAGPATWMYLVNGKQRPAHLKIELPAAVHWRVASGMPRGSDNSFTAPDYDTFIDSPIEISDFAEKSFTMGGSTYHVIVHDVMGKKDFSRFVQELQKVVAVEVGILEPVAGDAAAGRKAPFSDYWFLFHNMPGTGGGLEHLNSTQIFLSSDWGTATDGGLSPQLEGQLRGSAHEFFHAWNVKRLRPKPLGPFDYSREVYTPSLWISEGLTNYFSGVAMLRAGVITPERYLERLANVITNVEGTPGRKERSLEDASFDTWFWYVGEGRMPTNRAQVDVDYYTGGEIIGHLLDFSIRQATGNRKSLDDWMRLMYSRYALPKPGFDPEDAVRAASEVAGKDMSEFFRRYISGKEVPPYEELFGYAGIQVERKTDSPGAWLGAVVRNDGGNARVALVYPGSPAENAGLDRNDAIIAADGKTVAAEDLVRLLESKKPGDVLHLSVSHAGILRDIQVTLGANPRVTYRLRLLDNRNEMQRKIFESWSTGK